MPDAPPPWATLARTHASAVVLPRHAHSRGQLVFAIRGVMLVDVGAMQWTVPPQRALWLPPHQPHAVHILSATQMRTVYFQPAFIAHCAPGERLQAVHAVIASPLLRALVLGLFDPSFDAPAHATMATLLLQALRQTPALPCALPMPASGSLAQALAPLLQEGRWQLSMADLAHAAAMSERSFTRHFTAETGMSFRTWRQRARLLASLDLLHAGLPVKTIARRLQFASEAAYAQAFRGLFASTPVQFRLQAPAEALAAASTGSTVNHGQRAR
ncbi:AraC family transcriptional regulator [Pseudorhodoferax sp.]|uniref:AraC family transcriptional regulator n=1 Tax=Pseudorhodoferax sp. TaxID=1993553 RepID=UPI002DD69631|nr:helix-turn-helix transcriptional regulator [Pseudorhodoferax sp.]